MSAGGTNLSWWSFRSFVGRCDAWWNQWNKTNLHSGVHIASSLQDIVLWSELMRIAGFFINSLWPSGAIWHQTYGHHWFRKWFLAWKVPSHYLNNADLLSIKSLAPGKLEWNFSFVIFKGIFVIAGWGISCEITLIWMPLDLTDDQSTLIQVMAYLTHSPWTKWPPFCRCFFPEAFSLMKSFVFRMKFHWSLFLMVQLTITQHWFR